MLDKGIEEPYGLARTQNIPLMDENAGPQARMLFELTTPLNGTTKLESLGQSSITTRQAKTQMTTAVSWLAVSRRLVSKSPTSY